MNANQFRQLYDYHFALNRRVWEHSISGLTDEQFLQDGGYSYGSPHHQTVHLMSVEQRWFAGLRGDAVPDFLDPADYPDRAAVRAAWDEIEGEIRTTLAGLTDERLGEQFAEQLQVWQVLFHVLNHATDHRAQLLATLHQLGAPTFPQDYVHFVFAQSGD